MFQCQKRIDRANNYLKKLCVFYGFLFVDNSNITENYLHHDEAHLSIVGSFSLGQSFSHFNKSFRYDETFCIGSNLQIVNSGTPQTQIIPMFVTNNMLMSVLMMRTFYTISLVF